MTPHEQFARWIKEHGLKKSFVAAALGVNPNTIASWLKGGRVPATKWPLIEAFTEKHGKKLGREIWGRNDTAV